MQRSGVHREWKLGRPVASSERVESVLRELFVSQRLAVLATHDGDGQPYASLMAFAATDDLRYILVATGRPTRKYANLSADPRVALLIDSRSNRDADIHRAVAATVVGRAEEVEGIDRDRLVKLYLAKHPHLEEFVTSPSCVLIRVKVVCYYLVSRFQEVTTLHITP